MSIAVALLGIGVLLIALLIFLLCRRWPDQEDLSWPPRGSSAIRAQSEDRRKEQLNRIFGREDWDFIRTSTSKQVQRLFLKEREGIVLSWLSQLRMEARAGMYVHLTSVRASKELEPLAELRLAIDYYAFLAKCELITAVLWLGGPLALRDMVGQAESLSSNLRRMLEAALRPEGFSQKTRIR